MFACEIPGGSILPTRVIVTRCRLDDWTRFNLFRYAAKQSACPRDGVTLKQTQHTHTRQHTCVYGEENTYTNTGNRARTEKLRPRTTTTCAEAPSTTTRSNRDRITWWGTKQNQKYEKLKPSRTQKTGSRENVNPLKACQTLKQAQKQNYV